MKISRPGSLSPTKTAETAGAKGPAAGAEKVAAQDGTKAVRQAPLAHAPAGVSRVADIAADLKAGKISTGAALDKVIERVLDRQLGTRAPASLREKVGAALRDALADDPLLASKVRVLEKD